MSTDINIWRSYMIPCGLPATSILLHANRNILLSRLVMRGCMALLFIIDDKCGIRRL